MSIKKKKKKTVRITSLDELVVLRQSKDVNELIDNQLSFGEKLSDSMAAFAGSWFFIIFFSMIIIVWVSLNVFEFQTKAWDPYPFILLNLILSMIAALQAPIIMMSQNRLENKDRIKSEHEYHINLKSEILIEEMILKLENLEEQNKKLLEHIKKEEREPQDINIKIQK